MENISLEQKVKSILAQVRPFLQQDGGDVTFIELTPENVVRVQLKGACGSCSHAKITLKNGIEATLQKHIPEIVAVEDINML